MRILILNWRDIKNPQSGGAEILTHEMAKQWVKWGNEVIQISSQFLKSKKEETIDGVRVIRIGRWWSVHLLAFFYYQKKLRKSTDAIVDEVHWFPFFSALYAANKTVLLACEVANKLFFKLFPYPLALLGRTCEKIYLLLYQGLPTLAISQSTKNDLVQEGFPERNIIVLPMGVKVPKILPAYSKEKKPTVIYLGRLNKQKGIEDAIEAFGLIQKKMSESVLWVVGAGETSFINKIKKKVKRLLPRSVKFFGFVPELKKFELLARAHVLLCPSVHEGWGFMTVEAGIVGTPTVAYDVAGVKDVLQNGKLGVIVERNDPRALAKEVVDLLNDRKRYVELTRKLASFKKHVGWENTAKTALKVLASRNYEKAFS